MPEFRTAPEALTDAARAISAGGRLVEQVTGALGTSLREIGASLPASRTAREADRLGDSLPAVARTLTAELAAIAAALALAARDYVVVDEAAAGDFRRSGRWSA